MRNRDKITCECKTCISAMLFQLDRNKWRLLQLVNLDKLYIHTVSTRLPQRFNINLIEYKNQIILNNSHTNSKSCDDALSYHCTSQFTGSNIPRWDYILHCYSYFPRNNVPCL